MKIATLCVAAVLAALPAVAWGQDSRPQGAAAPGEPAAAASRVETALRQAEGVPGKGVTVSTHAQTVILTGEVSSEVEAARTLSVAEKAAGEVRVASQLEVRPAAPQAADEKSMRLVRDVEAALNADARTANLGIAVSIDERQVIGLHGLVPSADSRRSAEDIAGRAAGVTRVRSHLVIPGE